MQQTQRSFMAPLGPLVLATVDLESFKST